MRHLNHHMHLSPSKHMIHVYTTYVCTLNTLIKQSPKQLMTVLLEGVNVLMSVKAKTLPANFKTCKNHHHKSLFMVHINIII